MEAAGGRVEKKAVSKTATCGTSKCDRAASMPVTAAGLCSGARGTQRADAVEDGVVDDDRLGEVRPAVHDAVADGTQRHGIEVDAVVGKRGRHRVEARRVVGDVAAGLADALDDTAWPHLARLGHEQLVLQRGRPGVEHEDGVLRRS